MRISYVLGIYKALQMLLPDAAVADAWIKRPDTAPLFTPEFGACYASRDLATAIEETRFHRARFMTYTGEPPMEIDRRVPRASLSGGAPSHGM